MLCTHAIGSRNEWTDAISQPPAEIGLHVDLTAGKSHLICLQLAFSLLASGWFTSYAAPKWAGHVKSMLEHICKFLQLMPITETVKVHCLHT